VDQCILQGSGNNVCQARFFAGRFVGITRKQEKEKEEER
jgi:hypothetical protein